ncbi:hypothetical protein TNCV_4473651 [Trichonephila clavipes]|nr:hypothetical protein TNCV_4473651 [Trichonephila clavipes]
MEPQGSAEHSLKTTAIVESTCHRWFRKFREGGRNFQEIKSGRPSHIEEDVDQAIRSNPVPTVQELLETFNVHRTTVQRRLVNLGFT